MYRLVERGMSPRRWRCGGGAVFRHKSDKVLSSGVPPPPSSYPYKLTIGEAAKVVDSRPGNPDLIPRVFDSKNKASKLVTNTDLKHLEWMLKKDTMGQDMFLIGPPGSYKRRLVQLYAYVASREIQFVQISRDTTEADIKQRREIIRKSAVFFDQPSVRCALGGQMLILDGIEKAERNVLPLLNNLLENREMQLEDGRHLIPHTRYDTLLREFGQEAIQKWKLERVHENFRVVALGLPVPTFKGNPLDPPLRSRFQARNVDAFTRDEIEEVITVVCGQVEPDVTRKIIDLAYALNFSKKREFKEFSEHAADLDTLPWFVVENLVSAVALIKDHAENTSSRWSDLVGEVFKASYPFEGKQISSLMTDHLGSSTNNNNISTSSKESRLVDTSNLTPQPLPSQRRVLDMLHTFMTSSSVSERGALVYGPQGSGKSTVVDHLAKVMGRSVTHIQVYKDMSTRELFQTRTTDLEGNTVWRLSPLTLAAIRGDVCVLDGIENLHESVFNVVGKLVHDREVLLPDGSTTLSSSARQASSNFIKVHEDFRLVAVGNSSDVKLSPELSSVFLTFSVGMSEEDEERLVTDPEVRKVLQVARELRKRGAEGDKGCATLARALNITQVKRIGRRVAERLARGEPTNVYADVFDAVLGMFLPAMERETLVHVLKSAGIREEKQDQGHHTKKTVSLEGGVLTLGDTSANVFPDNEHKPKVPHALFYDIDQHVRVLEAILRDFLSGDHLLLIGNQGVGKNKIIDRMLMLLNVPREYVQLHRDTTVQSLTTIQRIEDGVVKTEDSPLVNAAKHGLVLVVDEADKAPAHVTAVLKTLAERGEMILPDGRRITRENSTATTTHEEITSSPEAIQLHQNFRMVVLANRPGFPFLGNNFYTVLSHLFSVNPISNPTVENEVQLLSNYAPSVDPETIMKIANVFAQLRKLSDDGVISYPYSTREAVHIVKHLQVYPGDVRGAFRNVFDFDSWSDEAWKSVTGIVAQHFGDGVLGLEADEGDGERKVLTLEEGFDKDGGGEGGESHRKDFNFGDPKVGQVDPTGAPHVGGNTWAGGSGGMGTAGLGGAGGPYRLSDGNPVFQVSPEAKASVPPEIRQKAREMARKAFEEKLRELKMSEYDGRVYEEYVNPIRPQIQSLRTVLESLQSKSKERKWVRHQTSGDLDDGKLIEGIVGEKNIYRMRKDENPEVGDPIVKPKVLRLIVDCSGSMYRFNGYDKRLDRMMSSVLMVMESFSSFEEIFKYEIYIHSGDEYDYKIVDKDEPPKTEKGRIEVMKLMFLHSQFCSSGDHTLEATVHGVRGLRSMKEDADELFLIVLSDANLERYGIRAQDFGKILVMDKDVKSFAVFIGSLGDQAERLSEAMPPGKAFVCMDTARLPKILQKIFVESVFQDHE